MSIQIDKIKYQIHKASGTLERYKGDLVGTLIEAGGYSINDQISLIRQKDEKPEEFAIFTAFADECVATVNKWFAEMENN